MFNDKKNIEIVTGNGENLKISDVQDTVDIVAPLEDSNVKKNVIIPEEHK